MLVCGALTTINASNYLTKILLYLKANKLYERRHNREFLPEQSTQR